MQGHTLLIDYTKGVPHCTPHSYCTCRGTNWELLKCGHLVYLSDRTLVARGLGCICGIPPVVVAFELWDKMRPGFERVLGSIACHAKGSVGWPDSADAV